MRRAWRAAVPVALTLPLDLARRPRLRQRRLRRLAIGALIVGAAVLAAGFWLPVKAELAQRLLTRASGETAGGAATSRLPARADRIPFRSLATLAVGDELVLQHVDGAVRTYEVAALDVVYGERVEFAREPGDDTVVLVTRWPFEGAAVEGSWRYVVTARRSF